MRSSLIIEGMQGKSFDRVIVHYGEIGLKGKNRPFFEKKLVENIRKILGKGNFASVKRQSGRIIIKFGKKFNQEFVEEKMKNVFGVANFSFGYETELDLKKIGTLAFEFLENKKFSSFKVQASRANKKFHLNSQRINEIVGAFLKKRLGKKVDLERPGKTVFVEIGNNSAFLYFEKIKGLGGLPVGVSGKAVSMLSGGIDSPAASFKCMKRGLRLVFAHFHSHPFTNKGSIEKVKRIAGILDRYQKYSKLYLIPFAKIQEDIVKKTDPRLRVVLYRRTMHRIAEKIAKNEGAKAVVTGESLGQVASQTLENIFAINEAAKMPVLRPLIGEDKNEIIELAKKIGTYEISIEPHQDCCTLFLPKRPETRADMNIVKKEEKKIDKKLVAKCMKDAMVVKF